MQIVAYTMIKQTKKYSENDKCVTWYVLSSLKIWMKHSHESGYLEFKVLEWYMYNVASRAS